MKGKLFVISGPSGVGKGTVVEGLLKNPELNLYWAKSYTTRPERPSDKSENHYLFVGEKKFKELEENGEVLESNFYNESWYGSSKSEIDKGLDAGKNILKEIEVNGAMAYKKFYPNVVLIFIKADLDDIKKRLESRGQNTAEEIEARLRTAETEMNYEKEYDYSIVNPEGHPEKAVEEIEKIITKGGREMSEKEGFGENPEEIEEEPFLTAAEIVAICLKAIDERPEVFSHLSDEDRENLIESLKDVADDDFDLDTTMGNIVGLLTDANLDDPIGFLVEIGVYQ